MKYSRSSVLGPLRLLTLASALLFTLAHADEYADVSQLVRSGKLPEALAKADQYLVLKPRDPQMRFLKGVIQRDSGKTTDAISTFTRLTEDFPELPEPYNNLAVLYAGQSQFDKARTALEMAIRTNPSYATAHENLGDVYAKLASQAYNKALQLDASNTGVPPKLALIRELFNPGAGKGQPHPGTAPLATPAPSTPVAITKQPPTLTAPTATKATTPTVAATQTTTASSTPAANPVATTTPAATSNQNATTGAGSPSKDAEAAVYAWAKAWASKDVKSYLASYSKDFVPPNNMNRNTWEEERHQRITSKSSISVRLENLTVTTSGTTAVAKFRQDYKANGLAVSSRKTLDLVKYGDHWQIVKESTGA